MCWLQLLLLAGCRPQLRVSVLGFHLQDFVFVSLLWSVRLYGLMDAAVNPGLAHTVF
jgi:hypothetical protein